MQQKVFCIGFHKTGTSSLGDALAQLGYRVTGPNNGQQNPDIEGTVIPQAFEIAEEFDAFQDNPWPLLYKELDAKFPGSKFILTLRDPHAWIKSQINHFGREETPMRRWIYGAGSPVGNERRYKRRLKRHNKDVMRYFKKRPNDLLVMNLEQGDGWNPLCSFLGFEIPDHGFPHSGRHTVLQQQDRLGSRR